MLSALTNRRKDTSYHAAKKNYRACNLFAARDNYLIYIGGEKNVDENKGWLWFAAGRKVKKQGGTGGEEKICRKEGEGMDSPGSVRPTRQIESIKSENKVIDSKKKTKTLEKTETWV